MPLFRRIARRGFSNHPFRQAYDIVNVSQLNRFADGSEVDAQVLATAGLAGGRLPVKVLGDGTLERRLTVKVDKISTAARQKITAAKGTVELTAGPEADDTREPAPPEPAAVAVPPTATDAPAGPGEQPEKG